MRIALKIAIVRTGRTQRALSMKWRIPEARLSSIIRGVVAPTADERALLIRELRVSEDAFEIEPIAAAG